jgi:uncharacterized protein (TIGR00369 family)
MEKNVKGASSWEAHRGACNLEIGNSIMKDDHHRRLERMYLSAPCNEVYKPRIAIREGQAEVTIEAGPHLHHAARAVHGSSYFKLMDDAAFFAVNSLVEDVFVLTVSFNIYLLRPISEGTMSATGRVVNASRNLWIAESTLVDGNGKKLGRGSGSFMRSKIALAGAMGFAEEA